LNHVERGKKPREKKAKINRRRKKNSELHFAKPRGLLRVATKMIKAKVISRKGRYIR